MHELYRDTGCLDACLILRSNLHAMRSDWKFQFGTISQSFATRSVAFNVPSKHCLPEYRHWTAAHCCVVIFNIKLPRCSLTAIARQYLSKTARFDRNPGKGIFMYWGERRDRRRASTVAFSELVYGSRSATMIPT